MSLWLGEKTHLKKKTGLYQVARVMRRPGLTIFLLLSVFHLTRIDLTTRSTYRVDLGLITIATINLSPFFFLFTGIYVI